MSRSSDPGLVPPDEEELKKCRTEETRQALEKLVHQKLSAAQLFRAAPAQQTTLYIRYTPSQQGAAYNSGAKQRVIRMVEAQRDPMSPPRFKTNTKIPRGPPSPPAPVLHSPPREAVTAKEQQDWKIPLCISNWKNNRGYTIPLDKRLAADGRGLQDHTINDIFAKLAQALDMAGREARIAVETRNQQERRFAQKTQEGKEAKLRELARQARDQRRPHGAGIQTSDSGEDQEMAKQRDQLRYERHKERERDSRRSKPDRNKERDISEMIALGMPAAANLQEAMFDRRLFDMTQGLDSGYGLEDDTNNVYDKPWQPAGAGQAIYRPSKGFLGTDSSCVRDGPVQFEKEVDEDLFGLNQFLTEAKTKRPSDSSRDSSHPK